MDVVVGLVVVGFILWVLWFLFMTVGDMAERRGQNRFLWQVAALFINPIAAMALLLLFCRVTDR